MNLFELMTSKKGKKFRTLTILLVLALVAAMVLATLLYAVPS